MAAIKTDKLTTNNLILIVLLISLLVVGVSALVVKSLVSTIARDGKVVQKKFAADNNLKTDLNAAPQLVDSYKNLGDKAPILSDALPTSIDFPSILVTMENMANVANVKIKSVAPTQATGTVDTSGAAAGGTAAAAPEAPTAAVPTSYRFSIGTTGSYESTLKLLKSFELSARPLRVLDVTFNGSGSNLSSQIDIETYYQDKAKLPFGTETVE